MLVILAERIAAAYLSLRQELAHESLESARPSATRARYACLGARVRLAQHLSDHADAVERLRIHGTRWLDTLAQKHLERLASHLAGLGALRASEAADPGAS